MKKIKFLIGIFSLLLSMLGCSARPIKSSSALLPSESVNANEISSRTTTDMFDKIDMRQLRQLNQKANRPTFGLIMGFYQLPSTRPAGAVGISEGYVFGEPYRSFWFKETQTKPYAVLPASVQQLEVLSGSFQKMLDAGILFKEVSMADAVKVMQAEQKMMQKKMTWIFPRQLASGIDLLVSIQKGRGEIGPLYVGRVIATKDGRLLALAAQPDAGVYVLQPLLEKLVKDALLHLADE